MRMLQVRASLLILSTCTTNSEDCDGGDAAAVTDEDEMDALYKAKDVNRLTVNVGCVPIYLSIFVALADPRG